MIPYSIASFWIASMAAIFLTFSEFDRMLILLLLPSNFISILVGRCKIDVNISSSKQYQVLPNEIVWRISLNQSEALIFILKVMSKIPGQKWYVHHNKVRFTLIVLPSVYKGFLFCNFKSPPDSSYDVICVGVSAER